MIKIPKKNGEIVFTRIKGNLITLKKKKGYLEVSINNFPAFYYAGMPSKEQILKDIERKINQQGG